MVIVYGIVQKYGVDGLMIATLMGGLHARSASGSPGWAAAIKFIPFPVVTGFTTGIALIIFSGQVKDLLGLRMGDAARRVRRQVDRVRPAPRHVNPSAVLVSALTLLILVLWPRLEFRVPGPFVALIATTLLVHSLHLPVETIGSRFGAIDAGLPRPSLPQSRSTTATALVGPAFTIAMLAGIESLLSAVVADGMIGGKHRSNMELVAQGVANIVSPLFGGIPATGAIARTATNVKNGGRTPVAGIVHALTLLLITLFFGRWAGLIPMATLAGILVVVAYHMSEWRTFRSEFRAPKSDLLVLLTTFLLTVLVDLTVAVEVGIVLAAFLFMRRMAEVTNVSVLTREFDEGGDEGEGDPNSLRRRSVPPGVEVYEINGPFFFGAAEKFKETLTTLRGRPKVLILRHAQRPRDRLHRSPRAEDMVRRFRGAGTRVILSDVHAQPMVALQRSALGDELPEDDLVGNIDDALNVARAHLDLEPVPRPEFAVPTVAREDRRQQPRPRA